MHQSEAAYCKKHRNEPRYHREVNSPKYKLLILLLTFNCVKSYSIGMAIAPNYGVRCLRIRLGNIEDLYIYIMLISPSKA